MISQRNNRLCREFWYFNPNLRCGKILGIFCARSERPDTHIHKNQNTESRSSVNIIGVQVSVSLSYDTQVRVNSERARVRNQKSRKPRYSPARITSARSLAVQTPTFETLSPRYWIIRPPGTTRALTSQGQTNAAGAHLLSFVRRRLRANATFR